MRGMKYLLYLLVRVLKYINKAGHLQPGVAYPCRSWPAVSSAPQAQLALSAEARPGVCFR